MDNTGHRPSNTLNSDINDEQVRFTILLARLLLIIQSLSSFEWPHPLCDDPEWKDKSRFCEYHKDFEHKTNSYFQLRCLLNYLIRKRHLQEYMESSALRESPSPPSTGKWPVIDNILATPKLAHARGQPHARIFLARVNYSFALGSARPIDRLITFFMSSLRQLA